MTGVQIRYTTCSTSEHYVSAKLWQKASLQRCPWHPEGGCGFSRHGTYPRVRPRGTLIARWYCPKERRTVSALPECLASHYSGTLEQLEAHAVAVGSASSVEFAAQTQRLEIELPGALRYLRRLSQAVHTALIIIAGLIVMPSIPASSLTSLTFWRQRLALDECDSVLMRLREHAWRYLPQLPTPIGFRPPHYKAQKPTTPFQHPMGRDPPQALLDPCR